VRPLAEQTVLVTGSTDGLGRRVAEEVARRGATVLLHGRDPDKVERVSQEVGAARGLVADLGKLDEVRRLADEVETLDTLVNNAGVIVPERRMSPDGHELTFAVNYLSHFLLTVLLVPKLREPARIVNVASLAQEPIDFDDLHFQRGYADYPAYSRSKLAQVMFTAELAERLGEDRDVTVNALHPASRMDTKMVLERLGQPSSSVEEGVEATVRLVADPELDGVSGRFFNGTREWSADPQAADPAARRRLWEESERLAGVEGWRPPRPARAS
jgi:NAD(P)-dependent dehydrogenase (short-subunit alcohol dehydrogenase family)